MPSNPYLIAILIISICGILFSGYLSYKELFSKEKSCSVQGGSCGIKIAGLPVCIYGLLMYLLVFVISLVGILKN